MFEEFDDLDASSQPTGATAPGFFNRISAGLQDWFKGSPADESARPADLDPRLLPFADKVTTAEEAVSHIRSGSHVFVGTASATPRALVAALETMSLPPAGIELLHFITSGAFPHDDKGRATTRFRHRTFFVGSDIRAAVKQGLADYVPLSIARVPQLIEIGRIPLDVALIQVSMPDEFGYVSLGVSVDVIPAAIAKADLVIAEVNPFMPRSMGDSTFNLSQFHYLVPVATPVQEYVHPATEERVVEQIATVHRRHHRGRLDAADRPGPGHQRGAQVPVGPQGHRHPLRRDHRCDHSAAGKGRIDRPAEDQPARQDRDQLRDRHEAPVRPDRPQSAVLLPAHRRGVPPVRHCRAAPDGLGDAGLRDRPDGAGVRGPVARRVLCRSRGAGRVPARRVTLGRGQGHHLSRLDGGWRQCVVRARDARTGRRRHHRPHRRALRDHRVRHRVPVRQVDTRARHRADPGGASEIPRGAASRRRRRWGT